MMHIYKETINIRNFIKKKLILENLLSKVILGAVQIDQNF